MKKTIILTVLSVLLLSNCYSDDNNDITEAETQELTQDEINDLIFLREEEKLARDVYLHSFNTYNIAIFNNIAKSEQSHMDNVLAVMKKYNIPDSANVEIGVFNNQEIQTIYDNLIIQSDISLVEALIVGAIIEDLDINDIKDFINNTIKPDLLSVYDKLTCGSKNHIRSYTNQLYNNDIIYTPQYISIDYYNSILSETGGGCGN